MTLTFDLEILFSCAKIEHNTVNTLYPLLCLQGVTYWHMHWKNHINVIITKPFIV